MVIEGMNPEIRVACHVRRIQGQSPSPADDDAHLINAMREQAEAWRLPETKPRPRRGPGPQKDVARDLPADPFPGYEITREIHRGGQGVVYQAIQKATKRKVAIKVMHVRLDGTEPGLVAYWRLDDGQGLVATDSAGDRDGALVNGPGWTAVVGDCNTNGVPDSCDIADGASADCNADGIPNECEGAPAEPANLIHAVSRKLHGGTVGEDDIVLNQAGRLENGDLTSESRGGGISELRMAFHSTPVLISGSPA